MRPSASAALAVVSLALASCAPEPVSVQLGFPSTETFLYSDFARLLVYPSDLEDSAGGCPVLLNSATAGDFGEPVYDSDWRAVCAFREGGVRFDDVPEGPNAYLVVTRDESNNLLLSGCRVAEVYVSAPSVTVSLFPTPFYSDATAGRALVCSNEEDKCRDGC